MRFDLDGDVVEAVSAAHRDHARQALEKLRRKR
jgi:sRNA-binding protein